MENNANYLWLEINNPDDYDKLIDILDTAFEPAAIASALKSSISNEVGAILVEQDYVDKDYRSTYYNFYAKTGRPYRDDCVRIHFFDKEVNFSDSPLDLKSPDDWLEERHFGYIVLRPTIFATLGRSVLSPRIRIGARGKKAIQSRHKIHLLGYTFSVQGFPSMAQHADIAVCAHVCCWAILRHYSEKYSQHRELLVHDVTRLANPFDPGGLTPSLGLNIYEAERIFQAAGCYPLTVVRKFEEEDGKFYAQLLSYLESGFPLFVAMDGKKHAIVVAGYSWRDTLNVENNGNSHVWSQIDSLMAVDDNLLPYSIVNVDVNSSSGGDAAAHSVDDFSAFIVPLPEKIFYSANAVESFSLDTLYQMCKAVFDLPDRDVLIRRYFITTVSALRRYARENRSQMGDELVDLFMRLKTAQFVWVIEYSSQQQWNNHHIAARAIVDATASPKDRQPVWMCHDRDLAVIFDRSSGSDSARVMSLNRPPATPLGRMDTNLKTVRS